MSRLVQGVNDLETWCAEHGGKGQIIMQEWNYEQNARYGMFLEPRDFSYGTDKKVWWRCCRCGNEYELSIRRRLQNVVGCSKCRLNGTSFSEQYIYFALKQIYDDVQSRIKAENGLEFDIALTIEKIYIEYNGEHWHTAYAKNEQRKRDYCKKQGIRLIEIWEHPRKREITVLEDRIDYSFSNSNQVGRLEELISVLVKHLGKGDCLIDFDAVRNMTELSMLRKMDNSLLDKYPQLCEEWDYELNGIKRPEFFSCSSAMRVFWRCIKCKKVRDVTICSRTQFKTGCPYCHYNIFDGSYHIANKKVNRGATFVYSNYI